MKLYKDVINIIDLSLYFSVNPILN